MKKCSHDQYLQKPDQTVKLHGIEIPLEYLYRGLLAVGQPGSGKTRGILLPLLRSILHATGTSEMQKAGLIIADPKGEFAPFLEEILVELGRKDDLITLAPGKGVYNPLGNPFLNDSEMVEKIIGFSRNTHRDASQRGRGEEAFWSNSLRSMLSAIIAITRAIHGPHLTFGRLNETFDKLNGYSNFSDTREWLACFPVSEIALESVRNFFKLPAETTRSCIAISVANTLRCWQVEPLCQLVTPTAELPSIDPMDIIHRGKILLISCSGAAFGVSITPLLVALKEHLFTTMLTRDQIDICDETGAWGQINQLRPVFFFADEFQCYVSTDASMGELVALDRLRSFKGGYIAATQNLASLHSVLGDSMHANRLIALFSNQIYLSNICQTTAQQAEFLMGTKRVKERQFNEHPVIAPPLLTRERSSVSRSSRPDAIVVTRDVPRVNASILARMKTGEFWFRMASGNVFRRRPLRLT